MKVLHWINMGIFPGIVMFSSGFSYAEIMKELKGKKRAKEWIAGIRHEKDFLNDGNYFALRRDITINNQKKILYYIICKPEFKFTDECYLSLAHECLHVCQFHLPDILDRNREHEAEAYLHTHIMSECLKALRGIAS